MCKIDDKIVKEAKDFVINLLDKRLSEKHLYHTCKHTLDVLKNAEVIGKYSNLDRDDLNVLRISTLFHDVGYIDTYDDHEAKSAIYATDFLKSKYVNELIIKRVVDAILSTQVPQKPDDKVSEMLCDADLMYLANESEYFEKAELLRQEWFLIGIKNLSEYDFYLASLEFFNSHHYHTEYGKSMLQPKKEFNAKIIREKASNFSYKSTM